MKYTVGQELTITAKNHGHEFDIGTRVSVFEIVHPEDEDKLHYGVKDANGERWWVHENEVEAYLKTGESPLVAQIDAIRCAMRGLDKETGLWKALNDAGSTIAALNLTKNVPSLPMEYRGYTIQMDSRDYGPTEFMFYPTEEGVSHDADCTDGESFTYCGNCKWASDLDSAQYEIDDLVIESLNDRVEELEEALKILMEQVQRKCNIGSDPKLYDLFEAYQNAYQILK